MSTLAPDRTLLPAWDDTVERGDTSPHRPFGLTLSRPSGNPDTILDLTGTYLDPVTQTLVGGDGQPLASKKQTTQMITTNYKTTHDHQSWNDSKNDTYPD